MDTPSVLSDCRCLVGKRHDRAEIERLIQAGVSVRKIARAGASASAIQRHKRVCLGVGTDPLEGLHVRGQKDHENPRGSNAIRPAAAFGTPEEAVVDATQRVEELAEKFTGEARRRAEAGEKPPDRLIRGLTIDAQVEAIAELMSSGRWYGTSSVRELSAKWAMPMREIFRLVSMAGRITRLGRGDLVAQVEQSAATCERERDWLLAQSRERAKRARDLLRLADQMESVDAACKVRSNAAQLYATSNQANVAAQSWQRHRDRITQVESQAASISINVIANNPHVRAILDAIADAVADFPDAAEVVQARIAAVLGQPIVVEGTDVTEVARLPESKEDDGADDADGEDGDE